MTLKKTTLFRYLTRDGHYGDPLRKEESAENSTRRHRKLPLRCRQKLCSCETAGLCTPISEPYRRCMYSGSIGGEWYCCFSCSGSAAIPHHVEKRGGRKKAANRLRLEQPLPRSVIKMWGRESERLRPMLVVVVVIVIALMPVAINSKHNGRWWSV